MLEYQKQCNITQLKHWLAYYSNLDWEKLSEQDKLWFRNLEYFQFLIYCTIDGLKNIPENENTTLLLLRLHMVDEVIRAIRETQPSNHFTWNDDITNAKIALQVSEILLFHSIVASENISLSNFPVNHTKFKKTEVEDCYKNHIYLNLKEREKELRDSLSVVNNQEFITIRTLRINILQECSANLLNDTKCNWLEEINPKTRLELMYQKMACFLDCERVLLHSLFA